MRGKEVYSKVANGTFEAVQKAILVGAFGRTSKDALLEGFQLLQSI